MIDPTIRRLHSDLRKAQRGKWALFLGAGTSYDYGIPTMTEMAELLYERMTKDKPDFGISSDSLQLLRLLILTDVEGTVQWNIEQLLTRLQQLYDAAGGGGLPFVPATASVAKKSLAAEQIKKASNELLQFMASMCELSAHEYTKRGTGSIQYLSDFISAFSAFGNSLNIFTTNIDLCIEAAIVRLSQCARRSRRSEFPLIDGFDSGLIPIFDLRNYARNISAQEDVRPVYYWKLHGSIDWTFTSPFSDDTVDATPKGDNISCDFTDESIIMRRNRDIWRQLHNCGAVSTPPDVEKCRIAIFPTPDKYWQTYTFPYMDLFEGFRRILEEVELLLVVGTSFPDQHIKSAIHSFVERDNVLLFVVDPSPSMTRDKLVSLFGEAKTIQPVISMGFKTFVEQFIHLEAGAVESEVTESGREHE